MKPSQKLTPELGILISACLGASLLFLSAYFQYQQSRKSGAETDSLLRKATEQLENTNYIISGQKDLIDSASVQLKRTEVVIGNIKKVIETQQKVMSAQEETIKQILGGEGIPKLGIWVTDTWDPNLYQVDVGIVNNDDYPINSIRVTIEEGDEIFQMLPAGLTTEQQIEMTEKLLKSRVEKTHSLSLGPNSSQNVLRTVLRFDQSSDQPYLVDIGWMKGRYQLLVTLKLSDYVPIPTVHVIHRGGENLPLSEQEKYFLFRSEIPTEPQTQRRAIERRIKLYRK